MIFLCGSCGETKQLDGRKNEGIETCEHCGRTVRLL